MVISKLARKLFLINCVTTTTYRISSPTAMIEAVSMPFSCTSTFLRPLQTAGKHPETGVYFFLLPALSNLPSVSRYAGLNLSLLLSESLMHNNAFGTVSCMLPIEV